MNLQLKLEKRRGIVTDRFCLTFRATAWRDKQNYTFGNYGNLWNNKLEGILRNIT